MANYRKIHVKTWKDPGFQELTPEGKLLFLYLCTNESITESGIYPLTIKTICNETGMNCEIVTKQLENGYLRNVHYDFENHFVFVRKFKKYNPGGNNELIKKSISNDFNVSNKTFLWNLFNEEYPDYSDLNLQPLLNCTGICNGISKGIGIGICIEPIANPLERNCKGIAKNKKYLFLSQILKDKICEVSPDAIIKNSQLDNWANTGRLIIEQDKRTIEQIQDKIDWIFKDDFWSKVIRSMDKLRKQWNEGKLEATKKYESADEKQKRIFEEARLNIEKREAKNEQKAGTA